MGMVSNYAWPKRIFANIIMVCLKQVNSSLGSTLSGKKTTSKLNYMSKKDFGQTESNSKESHVRRALPSKTALNGNTMMIRLSSSPFLGKIKTNYCISKVAVSFQTRYSKRIVSVRGRREAILFSRVWLR